MSRYLIATAISVTAFTAVTLPSVAAPKVQPNSIEVAQAPDSGPAAGGSDESPEEGRKRREKGADGDKAPQSGAPAVPGGPSVPGGPPATQGQQKAAPAGPGANGNDADHRGRRERDRGAGAPSAPAVPPGEAPPGAGPPAVKELVQPPLTPAPPPVKTDDGDQRGEHRGRGERNGAGGGAPPGRGAAPKQPAGQPPPAAANPPPPGGPGAVKSRGQFGGGPGAFDAIKRGRRERVEEGGKRTITEEPGNRTIVQEKGGRAMIRHDENERLRATSRSVRSERRPDGGNLSIAIRPGGIEVYSEFDSSGRLQRRYRRGRDGREMNLIDNRRFRGGGPIILNLRAPILRIPRERYIVDYDRASDEDIYEALDAPPIERLERGYSLDEIRYNNYLRDRMRRVDLDTVNFEFGEWEVPPDQYQRLERVARAINRMLDRRPDEVFLIEGHTDAVGAEIDNLTLSDRRAESVAIILTETFGVPPENLVTQGYGEEFLKIPTEGPERINRRVAVRRITPLLARDLRD